MHLSTLEVSGLEVCYGKAKALSGVSLEVGEGQVASVVGPNGVGKSTLAKAIMGLVKQSRGSISFMGKRIDSLPTQERVKLGIGYCPERGGIFRTLTVWENLKLTAAAIGASRESIDRVYELFPVLKERGNQVAGTLSGGEQKSLSIAKALLGSPKLLVLDEPSAGLAPILREKLVEKLEAIKEMGVSILLTEQDAALAMRIGDHLYFMEHGTIAFSGSREEVSGDERLRRVYLGL
ncbi:MAG: branched-chain amino acid ABC transporter ATP-binding protein [Thermoproteota archaeon]|nr:MAG: branched-chain amino acid ABC transporter ATP-binding protein [Candidatus Korarchaeota archaeon]